VLPPGPPTIGGVTSAAGWDPLEPGERTEPVARNPFVVSPFRRLARVHALVAGADGALAVALAGSLFFSIDPQAARWRVAAYLLFSLAPFAIVAPFVGPIVDRMPGGRRLVVIVIVISRVLVTVLMARNLDSLLLFPLAFLTLVLQKSYSVSRSALVPTTVRSDAELVEANAKLGLISGICGFVFAFPALVLQLVASELTMLFSAAVFVAASVAAFALPLDVVASSS
jgi:hypothetical protein